MKSLHPFAVIRERGLELSVPVTLPVVGCTSLQASCQIQAVWCLGFAWPGKTSSFPPAVGAGVGMGGDGLWASAKAKYSNLWPSSLDLEPW